MLNNSCQKPAKGRFELLPVIAGLFVAVLVLSNILAAKIVRIGPLVFDGGTLLFPLSYIFGDILAEVYGYREARKIIWTGLGALLLLSLSVWLIGRMPADPAWRGQQAYDALLSPVPRIVAASMAGYFAGAWSNAVVLSRVKLLTGGRRLWMRTLASTLVGELLDTLLFVGIAFAGLYGPSTLLAMLVSNYCFKCGVEAAFTPLTYLVVAFVKRREGVDVYDRGERYNPLPLP